MLDRFETFTISIAKISRNIRKIKTFEVEEFDLKGPHVSCLYFLYKNNGSLTAKELCDICDEDKAAISRSIDYLENCDYIFCDSQKEKRYKSPLSLTETGLKIAEKISKKIDNILSLTSKGLSEEDRNKFYESLILISDNLQKICDKYED